jgi:hypothetical protein
MHPLNSRVAAIAFLALISLPAFAASPPLPPGTAVEEPDHQTHAGSPPKESPHEEVISETACDINGDGVPERIQIVLTSGKRFVDAELWCGEGEKWEGEFVIRVRTPKGSVLRDTPLNQLFYPPPRGPMPMSFWTPKFKLVMHDYNHDGRMDFNLGQYGCCVGNEYKIFTISRNGTVSILPIKADSDGNDTWFVSPGLVALLGGAWDDRQRTPGGEGSHSNSTTAIKRSGRFTVLAYFNRDTQRHGMIVEKWQWVQGRFVRVSSR